MARDVVIVGGGLGGATLGMNLAIAGMDVLIIERESKFRDRIRGELMCPWGIAEARTLGVYDLLLQSCASELRDQEVVLAGAGSFTRDLVATTPARAGTMHFLHSEMQEVLLNAAEKSGATVFRGSRASAVEQGEKPKLRYHAADSGAGEATARLIIAADGRASAFRAWGGFACERDPDRMQIAGVLLSGLKAPADRTQLLVNTQRGEFVGIVPLPNGMHRTYYAHHKAGPAGGAPLTGQRSMRRFIEYAVAAGVPADVFANFEQASPLASFDGADSWVEHPHKDGVVLVGDAAASSDPTHGCGLSLTLRSVRLLRDALLQMDDWRKAAEAYARLQTANAASLRRITGWLTDLWYERGAEADRLRAKALPIHAMEPDRVPDFVGLGPDCKSDEQARMRFFCEA